MLQKYALRDHFAASLPAPFGFEGGVTLACTLVAEAVRGQVAVRGDMVY